MSELTLELTNRCPNECWHCSSEAGPEKRTTLDLNHAKALINEAVGEYHFKKINLSGGEPFEYPYLYEILEEIRKQNPIQDLRIYTSGSTHLLQTPFSKPKEV